MERNRTHFGQSRNCTLTSSPLNFTMAFSATCQQAEAILEGTYLQPVTPLPTPLRPTQHNSPTSPTSSPTIDDTANLASICPSDDDTDTRDTQSHQPLHLQRDEIPELAQLLIDHLCYKTQPDIISPESPKKSIRQKSRYWMNALQPHQPLTCTLGT